MIYRFTIISDEVDDFVREIQIDPEATFYDFHEAILKSVGYANDQMTSFFICDDDWEKGKEVTLEEMDDNPEIDSWVMKDTAISELVEDEKQKLLYVFDYITERCFFIELSEIITGKDMDGAKCTKKSGDAPKQTVDFEEMAAASGSSMTVVFLAPACMAASITARRSTLVTLDGTQMTTRGLKINALPMALRMKNSWP